MLRAILPTWAAKAAIAPHICHAREILIEQRSQDAGFQRLYKRGETGNVGKKGRNLAALPTEVDGVRHPTSHRRRAKHSS
jgi:hypothetical protein